MADVLTIEHEDRPWDQASEMVQDCPTEKQGNALEWLAENRQFNDHQLFAHVTAEVQLALAATLRAERVGFPDGSNALGKHHGRRPANTMDFGHVEVHLWHTLSSQQLLVETVSSSAMLQWV